MTESSEKIIKQHFCLNDEIIVKSSTIVGFNDQLKDEIMIFEMFKSLVVYADSDLSKIINTTKRISIDKATKMISKSKKFLSISDERYYFVDIDTTWEPYDNKDLTIKNLTKLDEKKINALKKKCKPNELDLSQVELSHILPVGGYIDGKLVGIASIIDIGEVYDIGVIVDPSYRNLAVGRSLVTHLIGYSLVNNKIARYLSLVKNKGSMGIARSLKLPLVVKCRKIKTS